jgi:hypothetical protein
MLIRVLKDDGFFRFIDLAIKRIINYEKRLIWIKNFDRELEPSPHLKYKELDEDALLNLQYNKSFGCVDKFWNIAYGAQRCFGVYECDNLIHLAWVYHSDCPRYDLKEGEVFSGPVISLKEFRRRGANRNRIIYVTNLLREEGYNKIYGSTCLTNYPSMNSLSSLDWRISHLQKRLFVFGKKIFTVKK